MINTIISHTVYSAQADLDINLTERVMNGL